MKKLIDFDGLFDGKLAEYMEKNAGKYTEKEWEDLIPKLYQKFGDTPIKSVGNTPNGYYADMSDKELVETLSAHVKEGVPVSDFLCRELEKRNCPDELLPLLESGDEQLLTLAVNLAGDAVKAFGAYFDILLSEVDAEIKDTAAEKLKNGADAAKERALDCYRKGLATEYMLEILSRCRERDDRIFEILLKEFRTAEDLPMRASYLAAYGDERALPVLLETIDRDDINYLEYRELRYAIEALGGSYTRIRDFSDDPYFQEIASQSQIAVDFSTEKQTDA